MVLVTHNDIPVDVYTTEISRGHMSLVSFTAGLVTVSTVVLNCCKGDKPSQWETPIFRPV